MDHFLDYLRSFTPREDDVQYVLDWVAAFRQHPATKPCALIFCGPGGAGRSIFGKVLRKLCSDEVTEELSNLDSLFQKFNGNIARKYLINLEEMKVEQINHHIETLKHFMTAERWDYQDKNETSYQGITFHHVAMYTNKPILFGSDAENVQRRITQIKTVATSKTKQYFKEMQKDKIGMTCKASPYIQDLARFFDNRDISNFSPVTPHDSTISEEVLENGTISTMCYFLEVLEQNHYRALSMEKQQLIQALAVYEAWMKAFPEDKFQNQNKLAQTIKEFVSRWFDISLQNGREKGKRGFVWDFSILGPKIQAFKENGYKKDVPTECML